MALGAQPLDILGMTLRQGLIIVGAGLIFGLAGAFLASRLVADFIAVSPADPLTYITVSAILTLVALLASYIPARRVTRVDPLRALRWE